MAGNKLMSGSTGGARCYVRAPLNMPELIILYNICNAYSYSSYVIATLLFFINCYLKKDSVLTHIAHHTFQSCTPANLYHVNYNECSVC